MAVLALPAAATISDEAEPIRTPTHWSEEAVFKCIFRSWEDSTRADKIKYTRMTAPNKGMSEETTMVCTIRRR